MSNILCTFSGKYGDILWSLPTAREISRLLGSSVDFGIMPYYQSLLPLLVQQNYIERAFIVEDWIRTHSNHGDGPWQPPMRLEIEYEKVYHLTYRGHPGISAPAMPLVDFVAYQQGIKLQQPIIPFIEVDDQTEELAKVIHFSSGPFMKVVNEQRLVSYSFNEQYNAEKQEFFRSLWAQMVSSGIEFFNVASVGWKEAAWVIKNSLLYVGCRSANWVIANGVGAEIISYEPHPSRHKQGHLGTVFGNPYGTEFALPFGMQPQTAGEVAAGMIKAKMERVKVSV